MAEETLRVGLVGIGAIGEPMGQMLLKRGYALTTTFHRNRAHGFPPAWSSAGPPRHDHA